MYAPAARRGQGRLRIVTASAAHRGWSVGSLCVVGATGRKPAQHPPTPLVRLPMSLFHCVEIERLKHELTLSPQRHRLRQLAGILRAVTLIDPLREYPYAFVCYQITGYRPRRTEDVLLDGRNVIADLVKLADLLTATTPIPASAAGFRLQTAGDLAKRFRVSTRTISRWRRRGLVGCWYDLDAGAPSLAFSARAVQCFVARNIDLIRRGSAFCIMGPAEKARMLARARELVATQRCSLHVVTLRLAEETDRAVETIRLTLRRFDRENPADALFDRTEQAQEISEDRVIYQAFVDGRSVAALARQFGKSAGRVRRILTSVRAGQLAAEPIRYVYDPSFDAADAETQIQDDDSPQAGEPPSQEDDVRVTGVPTGLPPYLQALYRTPLLTPAQERRLFRRMNFLLRQAELRRRAIAKDRGAASPADIAAVEALIDQATEVKNRITAANLRLVVSIARRHVVGRPSANLFELVSDGNLALIRAVERFDVARGFRFSTYASWAIMRSYARSVPEELTRKDRFRTGHEEILASLDDHRAQQTDAESTRRQIRSTLADHLAALDPRERLVVERHYGLAAAGASSTLGEIGRELGLSREGVRQIEIRALRKLRSALGEQEAELLAG